MTFIKPILGKLVGMLAVSAVAGCATPSAEIVSGSVTLSPTANQLGNIEYHTAELASELFANLPVAKQYRYAVAGFVPVKSLRFDGMEQHPLMLLGHQLEQGMMTEANRRGLITKDFKVTDGIVMEPMADRVFSRNVAQLGEQQKVDFFISGTITEQQEGAIVNARIVHVQSKDVVAAATKFFPAGVFWDRESVTSRNGMLYRKQG